MSKTLQLRRYDHATISTLTGAVGEIFVDLTKNTIVVQDGTTAGGFPLAKEAISGTTVTVEPGVSPYQIVNSFGNVQYSTVKYFVQCIGTSIEAKEFFLTNDGNVASVIETATSTLSETCVFSANIDNGTVNLLVSPTAANIVIDYTAQALPFRALSVVAGSGLPTDLETGNSIIDLDTGTFIVDLES